MWFPATKGCDDGEEDFQSHRQTLDYSIRWIKRGSLVLILLISLNIFATLGLFSSLKPSQCSHRISDPTPSTRFELSARDRDTANINFDSSLVKRDQPGVQLSIPSVLPELNWEAEQDARGQ